MPDQTFLDPSRAALTPSGAALVSVCISCRAKTPDRPPPGRALQDALTDAFAAQGVDAALRAVQCLSVCSRAATVAVQAPDGYTFLFGDLQPADADALATFLAAYNSADYGFVPWRERPPALRQKIVARLPPARWSPIDGRQPG